MGAVTAGSQAAKDDCRARLRVSDRMYVMSRRVRVVAGV